MGKVNESVASKFVFLLYLGEAGREGDLAALSNPSASVPGDVRRHLMSSWDSWRGACSEGTAQVVLSVLRWCWFHCSKDGMSQGSLADIVRPRVGLPRYLCQILASRVVQFLLLPSSAVTLDAFCRPQRPVMSPVYSWACHPLHRL